MQATTRIPVKVKKCRVAGKYIEYLTAFFVSSYTWEMAQ